MRSLSKPIPRELLENHQTLAAAADLAIRSFPFFLRFVLTKDEAESDPKKRIKALPIDEKPYILECARIMQREPVLWVPKSRRMIMTWLHSAELVWQALAPHSHLFVQQTKEDDSDWLVRERCLFVWEHLPEWLRFYAMRGKGVTAEYKYCKMTLPNRSQVWGVAQGPEQFRKFTPSGLFSDEVAVQENFKDAQTAIMPLAEKGCRVRFVSSARGGTQFDHMVNGPLVDGTLRSPYRGLREWRLVSGGHVLQVHYTADAEKDPKRDGAAWVHNLASTFDGGQQGSDWLQEMEISFTAKSGVSVYEGWDPEDHVVAPLDAEFLAAHSGPYWRAMDYGLRNPTACIWVTEYEGSYIVFDEFYKSGLTPNQIKEQIYEKSADRHYEFSVIDPRSDRHDVPTQSSAFTLLNTGEHAIGLQKANSSATGRELVREWLRENRLKVTSNCVNFIWEIERYKMDDWTPATEIKHNPKEDVRKKDDHLMDALKYFANGVLLRENRKKADPQVISIRSRRDELMHPRNNRYIGRHAVMRGWRG